MRSIKGHKMSTLTNLYIANLLPHGSGFNGDWEVKLTKDRVTCYNTYDHMDENGFYDAYLPFSVTFKPNGYIGIRFLGLTNQGRYFVEMDGLRQYFEDVFAECYEAIEKEMEWFE